MADIDRVAHAKRGVLAHLRRFGGGTGGPDGVEERLGGDHGALQAVLLQALLDAADDRPLLVLAQRFGGDDVGIVRGPVADADLGVFADHVFEADRPARVGA